MSATDFTSAVKYYEDKKNALHDTPKKDCIPVFKVQLLCKDESVKNQKLCEVWIFSWDGKGADFVENVNLAQLNEYSSLKQENDLYVRAYDRILEADYVRMAVEVLSDGKSNRMLRAVSLAF